MTEQNRFMNVTSLYQAFLVAEGRRTRPLVLTSLSPEYLKERDFNLEDSIFQILPAIPGLGISFEKFRDISRLVESEILHRLEDWLPFVPSDIRERAISDIESQLRSLQEAQGFGISAFHDLVTPERFMPMPYPVPYFWWLPYFRHPYFWEKLWRRHPGAVRPILRSALFWLAIEELRLEVDSLELAAWVEVAERLTRPRLKRIEEIVNSYLQYEIPYSLSPELQGQKIGDILKELRNAVYLPLVPTALVAGQHTTAGEWVLAMKVAFAGGGTVVILAAAVSLAEYLLNMPVRMKRRRK